MPPLGVHHLRDVEGTVTLHQVLAPGVSEDFPPPRTLDATPTTLPAPGRFSTITCWPHISVSFGPIVRASASVALPAPNGTMMRIGLVGKDCA